MTGAAVHGTFRIEPMRAQLTHVPRDWFTWYMTNLADELASAHCGVIWLDTAPTCVNINRVFRLMSVVRCATLVLLEEISEAARHNPQSNIVSQLSLKYCLSNERRNMNDTFMYLQWRESNRKSH